MKRLVLVMAAIAAAAGCSSPSEQLCVKNFECQGDPDPAASCAEAIQDCEDDAECQAGREACQAENDTLAACVLSGEAESACQGVGDVSFFLPTAQDACGDELDAFLNCANDN